MKFVTRFSGILPFVGARRRGEISWLLFVHRLCQSGFLFSHKFAFQSSLGAFAVCPYLIIICNNKRKRRGWPGRGYDMIRNYVKSQENKEGEIQQLNFKF